MPEAIIEAIDTGALNEIFERATPQKIVQWAVAQFGDELVMSSSFGAESALLIHLAITHKPDIRIVFTDTGYLFPETHAFMEELRRRFNLNVWTYRTRNDPITYLARAGEANPQCRNDVEACCAANKTEPFERGLTQLAPKAWMRGVRRNQAQTRNRLEFVEWSKRYNCHAISPLLNFSSRDIYFYMKEHNLPYHPLYEKGYFSIGCNPLSCTRAVQAGEDPRAGRWAGKAKVECGIHLAELERGSGI